MKWTVHHVTLSFADQEVEAETFEDALHAVDQVGAKPLRVRDEGGKTAWLNPGLVILPPDHAGIVKQQLQAEEDS